MSKENGCFTADKPYVSLRYLLAERIRSKNKNLDARLQVSVSTNHANFSTEAVDLNLGRFNLGRSNLGRSNLDSCST